MKALALHGSLRRWLVRLHRWAGLAIMACMLVAAVTGTWLVFRVELDRWINPHLRVVQPAGQTVPLADIVTRVERRVPGALVHALILPERADDALGVYLESADGRALELDQVFVNPFSGDLLGGRSTTRIVLNREHLDPLIDRLHYSLLLNGFGLWLMGIVAGVWLLTGIVGLALAWPRRWLRLAAWLPVLSMRADRGPYQTNYQGHRAAGVWLLPVLMLLAFTSFYQNLPQLVTPVVRMFSPLAVRPASTPVDAHAPMISPDQAVARVRAQMPAAQPTSIGRDLRSGRYSVLFHLPGDLSPHGDNWAFVDLTSGRLIGLRVAATSSAGDRFLTWIFPLHTGTAFGFAGRVVIAAAGIGLIALMATGLYLWWTKWQMRRRARLRPVGIAA